MSSSLAFSVDHKKMEESVFPHEFEIFQGSGGLAAIRGEWASITRAMNKPRFFHLYEWYESYIATLAEGTVYFVLMRRQGVPVGIFPLISESHKIAGLNLRSLTLPHHEHMLLGDAVLNNEETPTPLMRKLIAHLRRRRELQWDLLLFPGLLEDSCLLSAINAGPPSLLVVEPQSRSNYLPCLPPDEFSARLSNNFTGNLRKARNKLARLNGVNFVTTRTQPELDQALEEFLLVEASGWKGAGGEGSAINLLAPVRSFYQSLIRSFSSIGGCEINLLHAEGKCIAGQLCLVVGETCYILKIGYDETYSQVAPGNMLLEHTIKRFHQEGTIKYINLVSNTPWHANWKPQSFAVLKAYVFNSTLAGLAGFSMLRAKGPLSFSYKHWMKPLLIAAHLSDAANNL